ncbi:pro-sigmaK processing inhibitor BofA family protein [Paenibacillus septentrionalis]|uniref:Pro-sigmaK processing inhibitor BofA family protein n=1 Tax=Paenibacillus septentrionalis TaxID=429342 RepID=A0ABW1V8Z8_9BACL
MNMIWLAIFVLSSTALLIVLLRKPISRISLKKVIVHWVIAATALFLLNMIEFTQPYALPINPLTIGLTALLGIPGIALLFGLQYVVLV